MFNVCYGWVDIKVKYKAAGTNINQELMPWECFRDTGILAKNLKGYGIFCKYLKGYG